MLATQQMNLKNSSCPKTVLLIPVMSSSLSFMQRLRSQAHVSKAYKLHFLCEFGVSFSTCGEIHSQSLLVCLPRARTAVICGTPPNTMDSI
jgi:hypothetical protein